MKNPVVSKRQYSKKPSIMVKVIAATILIAAFTAGQYFGLSAAVAVGIIALVRK